MSYFNPQPFVFQVYQAQQPSTPSENQPSQQWAFPQPHSRTHVGGVVREEQLQQVKVSKQAKTGNRKRSSSDENDCNEQPQNYVHVSDDFGTPTKRRKGLSDATAAASNSTIPNYWGKLSF